MLDYDYIKNNCRLIAVDLIRQKELDADPKAIQQIEYVGQLNNVNGVNANGAQSMFVLMIWEKIKETRVKFSQKSVTVLKTLAHYEEVRVKLTNVQLNKLKSKAKNKTGTILRMAKNNFQSE